TTSAIPAFFFIATAPTAIYPLSLHDALPIYRIHRSSARHNLPRRPFACASLASSARFPGLRQRRLQKMPLLRRPKRGSHYWKPRSEEHTSELQSLAYLVCRLLLEKKNEQHIE